LKNKHLHAIVKMQNLDLSLFNCFYSTYVWSISFIFYEITIFIGLIYVNYLDFFNRKLYLGLDKKKKNQRQKYFNLILWQH